MSIQSFVHASQVALVMYNSLWPMDCSPPGSSVHGMLQARILEWVAMPSSRGSSQPRDQTQSLTSPALAGMFSTTSVTWKVSHFCTHFKIRLFGFFVSEFQQNFKGLEAATSLFHLTSLWHRLSWNSVLSSLKLWWDIISHDGDFPGGLMG